VNIQDLIAKTAAKESALRETRFVAPCVRGGVVRARVGALVQTFLPSPRDFEGWGVFAPSDDGRTAALAEEADLPLVARYLELFPLLRVRLAAPLAGSTWLAYPVSEGDMARRFGGSARPVVVHLVTEGRPFEVATVRHASGGAAFWFEDTDRRADPAPADALRDALRALTEPAALRFAGMTPEMRVTYTLATQHNPEFAERRRQQARAQTRRGREQFRRDIQEQYGYWNDHLPGIPNQGEAARVSDRREQDRLRRALALGGGTLHEAVDRGDYYLVEWEGAEGIRHTSAIAKGDLTVISSGICLSGRDHHFDLQSLVGVVEGRDSYWGV